LERGEGGGGERKNDRVPDPEQELKGKNAEKKHNDGEGGPQCLRCAGRKKGGVVSITH